MQIRVFVPLVVLCSLLALLVVAIFVVTLRKTPTAWVTIPEGATAYDVNETLFRAGVLTDEGLPFDLEGYLFPDTYEFFLASRPEVVTEKFLKNFDKKIVPLIPADKNLYEVLIVASLIEGEIPLPEDRRLVSGIIWKRLGKDFPLQIDATLCYIKEPLPCASLTKEDKLVDSPYNTYRNKGLPPTPIGNAGIDAIEAALSPQKSPYWFYLSDPHSRKTIFAVDLDEHNRNILEYLSQ